ncbi:hypothetical protein AAFN88_09935 [Pelagibius sp. CAU 1746]|uniref:hypothetical protein n=1 Tax=Pelagibius sp. CAU 1746 TaxID=3140370 RepID=UPI00325B3687
MAQRSALLTATVLAAACLWPTGPQAADSTRCAGEVGRHLEELPLADGEVKSVRIIERVNIADDFGPEIFGVDAWVRLNSCSGWLVINMTAKCYVRQSYTRGDCRVEGLSNF